MTSTQPATQSSNIRSVLFVCVSNRGKSQMAAGLLRRLAGDRVHVSSAATAIGPTSI